MSLTKGVLEYTGLGPNYTWTITSPTKGLVKIWPIFTATLRKMNRVRIRINPEQIELKSRDKGGELGILLNQKSVQEFILHQKIRHIGPNRT